MVKVWPSIDNFLKLNYARKGNVIVEIGESQLRNWANASSMSWLGTNQD